MDEHGERRRAIWAEPSPARQPRCFDSRRLETRELPTEHRQELCKKAQEKASEAQDMAGDLLGKGREYIEEQRHRLVGAFEAGRSAMKEEMGKLRSDAT